MQVALRGDTGIGKSHIIRELLADAIRAIRKQAMIARPSSSSRASTSPKSPL